MDEAMCSIELFINRVEILSNSVHDFDLILRMMIISSTSGFLRDKTTWLLILHVISIAIWVFILSGNLVPILANLLLKALFF